MKKNINSTLQKNSLKMQLCKVSMFFYDIEIAKNFFENNFDLSVGFTLINILVSQLNGKFVLNTDNATNILATFNKRELKTFYQIR